MKSVKANFHTHTIASFDGYNSFKALYKYAKINELDTIAITDHDTVDGAFGFIKWLKKNSKTDLNVIIGEEITCIDGTHVIGLYLTSHVERDSPLNVIKKIKEQNGLVYFPHPARKDGIMMSCEYEQAILLGDIFEVFNGKINHSFNNIAFEEFEKYTHLIPLGGSDAHYNADVQKCICEIELFDKDILEKALRNKNLKKIQINGYKNEKSRMYFGSYYKIKEKLNLPQFIREIGKVIYPFIQNYRNRNKKYTIEKVYYNEF